MLFQRDVPTSEPTKDEVSFLELFDAMDKNNDAAVTVPEIVYFYVVEAKVNPAHTKIIVESFIHQGDKSTPKDNILDVLGKYTVYSQASLIRTSLIRIIHLSGHLFGNQSTCLNRK